MTPTGPPESCPTCGAARLPNAQYCGECGSPFPLAAPPPPGGAWSQPLVAAPPPAAEAPPPVYAPADPAPAPPLAAPPPGTPVWTEPVVPPVAPAAQWPAPAGSTGQMEQEAAHRAFFGDPAAAVITEPEPTAPARRPGPGQIIPTAGSLGPAGEPPPPDRRRRGLLLVLVGVIVLLLLGAGALLVLAGGDDDPDDGAADDPDATASDDTSDDDSTDGDDAPVVTQGPPADGPDDELELSWTFQAPGTLVAGASAADGTAYVATEEGQVYAVEAASGVQLWNRGFDPEKIAQAPVVAPGVVLVQTTSGPSTGVLRGLDPDTGADRWTLETSAPPDPTNPPAAVVGDVAVAALSQLTGVDIETGEIVWQADASPEDAPFNLVGADDERVFIVTLSDRLEAYNASDGTQEWTIELDEAPLLGAAAADGALVVADEEGAGTRVRGLDAATGDERWTAPVDERAGSVVAAGDTVVVASDTELVAFAPDDGDERFRLENTAGLALVTAFDTRIYLAGFEVEIHDRESGALIGSAPQPDVTAAPVVVAGEQVIVVSGERLYALE